ncbi:MAG TPA: hypothetical protein VK662_12590 [Acidothermaceae bacterium]|jgi:hypothetical protein|nr:hypothetical protein [Acidothermaceae bacterium]
MATNLGGRRRVSAIAIVFAVAGCASAGGAGASVSDLSGVHASQVASTSASRMSVGTITGVARTYGGPMMSNGQMADNGNPWSGLTLTATQNGRVVASAVTGSDGSYTFALRPGTYVVKGCADATIVVVAGQLVHQDISCPVP